MGKIREIYSGGGKSTEIEKFDHVMLDLETMGTTPGSAILSIGAIEFDIKTGKTGRSFYEEIDLHSCFNFNLKASAATIIWWASQSNTAKKYLYASNRSSLAQALHNFGQFIFKDQHIWGNAARFDCGILAAAYEAINVSIPWDPKMELDVRTLVFLCPQVKLNWVREGVDHNPIDDCKNQIGYCYETYGRLKPQDSNVSSVRLSRLEDSTSNLLRRLKQDNLCSVYGDECIDEFVRCNNGIKL